MFTDVRCGKQTRACRRQRKTGKIFTYEYDALDQITRWGQIRGVNPAREMRAAYDEMNRLVAAPVWRDNGGGSWSPETDLDNNILTEIMDNSGAVRASYSYDPWGRVTKTSGDRDADFAFTGHYYHAASGLHLAPYRAYSADLGRWVSRDPLEMAELLPEGPNVYAYVGNGPVSLRDQLGLATWGWRVNVSMGPVDVSFGYTWDDKGGGEFQGSIGLGGTLGIGATVGGTFTSADRVECLHGEGYSSGISGGEGFVAEKNYVWGEGYFGTDIGFGFGAGSPISPQGFRTHTRGGHF